MHVAADRPTAAEVVEQLVANLGDLGEPELDPDRGISLAPRAPGTAVYINADALLRSSWTKRDAYYFLQLDDVQEVDNPALERRYEQYKQLIAPGGAADANEQLVFHGCAEAAIAGITVRDSSSPSGSQQRATGSASVPASTLPCRPTNPTSIPWDRCKLWM